MKLRNIFKNDRAEEAEARATEHEATSNLLAETIQQLNGELTESNALTADFKHRLDDAQRTITTKWRLGTIHLDPQALTANLRRFVPSIQVEKDGDKYVLYSNDFPKDEDFNRIQAELSACLEMDRT